MEWWFAPSIIGVVVVGILAGLVISLVILRKQKKVAPFSLKQYLHSGVGQIEIYNGGSGKLQPAPRLPLLGDNSGGNRKPLSSVQNSIIYIQPKSRPAPPAERSAYSSNKRPSTRRPVPLVKNDVSAVKPVSSSPNTSDSTPVQPYSRSENSHPAAKPSEPLKNEAPAVKPAGQYKQNDALVELENNLSIATRPVMGKPVPFQTQVWNTRRSEFNIFQVDLRQQITESYVDMLLANDVVWLINDLGRDSTELKNSYTRLKNKVAERLQQTMPAVWKVFQDQV